MTADALPPVVDTTTWENQLATLRAREKAATRELDAIAAERRRLPMVEMPDYTLDGADGPVRLAEVFDGKRQLIVYNHMWFAGKEWQCPGCTGFTSQYTRLEFLDSYDARFVIVTQGPIDEALAYKERVGNRMPWYSTANSSFGADVGAPPDGGFAVNVFLRDGDTVYRTWHTNGRGTEQLSHSFALIDLLPYGRQEEWQDSPRAGPSHPRTAGGRGPRRSPRPTAPRTPSVDRRTRSVRVPAPRRLLRRPSVVEEQLKILDGARPGQKTLCLGNLVPWWQSALSELGRPYLALLTDRIDSGQQLGHARRVRRALPHDGLELPPACPSGQPDHPGPVGDPPDTYVPRILGERRRSAAVQGVGSSPDVRCHLPFDAITDPAPFLCFLDGCGTPLPCALQPGRERIHADRFPWAPPSLRPPVPVQVVASGGNASLGTALKKGALLIRSDSSYPSEGLLTVNRPW